MPRFIEVRNQGGYRRLLNTSLISCVEEGRNGDATNIVLRDASLTVQNSYTEVRQMLEQDPNDTETRRSMP